MAALNIAVEVDYNHLIWVAFHLRVNLIHGFADRSGICTDIIWTAMTVHRFIVLITGIDIEVTYAKIQLSCEAFAMVTITA